MRNKIVILICGVLFITSCTSVKHPMGEYKKSKEITYLDFERQQIQENIDFFPTEIVLNRKENDGTRFYSFHYYEYGKEMINTFYEEGFIDSKNVVRSKEFINKKNKKGSYYVKISGVLGNPYGNKVKNPTLYFWMPNNMTLFAANYKDYKKIYDYSNVNKSPDQIPFVIEINQQQKRKHILFQFVYLDVNKPIIQNQSVRIIEKYKSGKEIIYEKEITDISEDDFFIYFRLSNEFKKIVFSL